MTGFFYWTEAPGRRVLRSGAAGIGEVIATDDANAPFGVPCMKRGLVKFASQSRAEMALLTSALDALAGPTCH